MHCIARGIALFWGGFLIVNLMGELVAGDFDVSGWMVNLTLLAPWQSKLLLFVTGALLITFAIRSQMSRHGRRATLLCAIVCLGTSMIDSIRYWVLLAGGTVFDGRAVSMSIMTFASLLLITLSLLGPQHSRPAPRRGACGVIVATGVAIIVFPLLQMMLFGRTDYRRPADAIVVFGARAYADGRLSDALADRVRTACDLYHSGLAPRVIMSGGPGDGTVHETEAMKRMAMRLGVPEYAIELDEAGWNTRETVRFVAGFDQATNPIRVLAVSHAFHLPRVKIAFERAGVRAYTVPAHEQYMLTKMPVLMAREVAAFWLYFINP